MSLAAALTYGLLFFSLYFEVFLLLTFIQGRWRKSALAMQTPAHYPSVAIVVPCHNEERGVAATMRSLLSLEYPREKISIIAVDDGSTDRTLEVLRGFETDSRVRVYAKENGGKHTAMNYALEHTDAELIGCLDADSVVEKGALLRMIPVFENDSIGAVTPGIHVREPKTILQYMQHVEYRLSIFNRFTLAALGSAFITPGPFSIFRASVVRELGGWRYAHSTEDMEIALRMQERGYQIANAPQAIVHTSTPANVRGLFRQRVRWTYGWLRNAVDYRHMIGNKKFGNLGLLILPAALLSIATGIFFFFRILAESALLVQREIERIYFSGIYAPTGSFDLFYINTNAMIFLVFASIALILALISTGSYIGTGSHRPPAATPLFLLFYSFLVPVWLSAAVIRAIFKTGVRWR